MSKSFNNCRREPKDDIFDCARTVFFLRTKSEHLKQKYGSRNKTIQIRISLNLDPQACCLGRAEGVPGPGGGDLQPEGGPQQTPQDCPADRTLSQVIKDQSITVVT